MIENQKSLLRYSGRSTVSKNDLTEAINDIQDAISKHLADRPNEAREMYELILGNLKQTNERLWFATSLRLGKIYLDERNFENLDMWNKKLLNEVDTKGMIFFDCSE